MYGGSIASKQEAQARHDAQDASAAAATAAPAAEPPSANALAGVPTAAAMAERVEQPLSRQPAPDAHMSRAEKASMLPSVSRGPALCAAAT
jgi:hypothetical protein